LCEHFGYSLRQALWELYGIRWEQAPSGLHWTILEMRAYVQAKDAVDRDRKDKGKHKAPLDVTPMIRRVWEIEKAIGAEKRARAQERQSDD